jgi:1,4-dihydroxy-2-naphthoate octaprenyltransferase
MSVRDWFREAIEPSLLMSFLLVTLGTAVAARDGRFNLLYYALAIIAVTLSQNAANVLNDYYDYKTGVDAKTIKTPFSGGSKYLVSGAIRPETAYSFGIASLLLAVPIGIYFIILRGVPLLAIAAIAGISAYFYTTAFARIYLGEFLAGLNLGPLAIIGAYYVQTGTLTLGATVVGIAPGIMIANVLFLNEVPDITADSAAGRRNIPILLGERKAVKLYTMLEAFAVAWTPAMVLLHAMPLSAIVTLLAAPFAIKAIQVAMRKFSNVEKLIPALAANVITAYLTIALLSIGYMISAVVAL